LVSCSGGRGRAMSAARVLGTILLVGGVALVGVGMSISHSVADSLSNLLTGRFTERTTWYLVGGGVSAVVGLLLTLGVLGRSRS
jgi:hypothetical protein